MDNRNVYQTQQTQNGFYPYMYSPQTATYGRPDTIPYLMPQAIPTVVLKGRPVSSFEEARVAQIDLDGSLSIFPDLGNQKIYTKRINPDGTAALQTYVLDSQPADAPNPEYVSQAEFAELKNTLESLVAKLTEKPAAKPATVNPPLNF